MYNVPRYLLLLFLKTPDLEYSVHPIIILHEIQITIQATANALSVPNYLLFN